MSIPESIEWFSEGVDEIIKNVEVFRERLVGEKALCEALDNVLKEFKTVRVKRLKVKVKK
jgi:hypothetical protein